MVTTVNPPETTENAVVHTPTVNTVEPAIMQEDPDDTLPVPAPVSDMAKDPPPKNTKGANMHPETHTTEATRH